MPNTGELETLIARLARIDFPLGSEQATREIAVNPLIGALGWDTFNPDEVAREYSVHGGKVDYCLRRPGKSLALIEVKREGSELVAHEEQLLQYAFNAGVKLAALTDGYIWWLYLPLEGGSWEHRRFRQIDLRKLDSSATAIAISTYLGRKSVLDGTAYGTARREFKIQERKRSVRAAMQKAWEQVLSDPDGLLRDLLAESVRGLSGHDPDDASIAEFLQSVSGTSPIKLPEITLSIPERVKHQPSDRKDFIGRRPAAFWINESRIECSRWRELLVRFCQEVAADAGGTEF